MKYAINLTSILIPHVIAWACMYLVCSFVNIDWSFVNWSRDSRTICALWSIIFGFALWVRLEHYHE